MQSNNLSLDFAYWQPASLGDRVWNDSVANGIQDNGELGMPGVTVTLQTPTTTLVTTTDANGLYTFTYLIPGIPYTLSFTTPAGFTPTTVSGVPNDPNNSDPVNGSVPSVILTPNENNKNIDAGFALLPVGLTVRKYTLGYDADIAGNRPVLNVGDSVTWTYVVTNAGGVALTNIALVDDKLGAISCPKNVLQAGEVMTCQAVGVVTAGAYVNMATVTGTNPLSPTQAVTATNPSHYYGAQPGIDVQKLTNGQLVGSPGNTLAFGSAVTWTYIVTNTGNITLSNITVMDNREGMISCPQTELAAGASTTCQKVGVVQIGAYQNMASVTGTMLITNPQPDLPNLPFVPPVVVSKTVTDTAISYYTGVAAMLGDKVWEDKNGNGIQDVGELGIPGVTVTLQTPTTTLMTLTSASGIYTFSNLVPGVGYTVTFATPQGYVATLTSGVPNDASNSDPVNGTVANIVLAPNESNLNIDAGFWRPAVLGDKVWNDSNTNGTQESGEPGLPGVTVTLYTPTGTVVTVTDPNGNYTFTNLAPGIPYTIAFTTPIAFTPTTTSGLPNDPNNSDPVNGKVTNLVLTSGENNLNIDAGFRSIVAMLGDRVWEDVNGNGLQDVGELGIAGVTVTLLSPTNTVVMVTDQNGYYTFTNLLPAVPYTVQFTTPAGYSPTQNVGVMNDPNNSDAINGKATNIVLGPNESNLNIDAGFFKPAVIGDFVWYDKVPDGQQGPNEKGIPNVTVTLVSSTGVITTVTDANGAYTFTNLVPGIPYTVEFSTPNGYSPTQSNVTTDTLDSDAINGKVTNVVLVSGENNKTIDAGFYPPYATLGNGVWEDINHNGLQDPNEPGIPGVTVTLYTPSGVITTVTDAKGLYTFTNVTPGVPLTVAFSTPTGYLPTLNTGVVSDTNNSDPIGGKVINIILGPEDVNLTIDAGFWRPLSLGDLVWEDLNHNGQQDSNEPGIANVIVVLTTPTGTLTSTTTVTGYYQFDNLLANVPYSIEFIAPQSYVPTTANIGGDTADSDPVNGKVGGIVLSPGISNLTVDAGFWRPASLGDRVWLDVNNNGIQDAGEPGVANVPVKLYLNGIVISTTTTNASGNYLFTNLISGTYTATFTLPGGYIFTPPNVGGDEALDSDADISAGTTPPVNVVSGATEVQVDVGLFILPQLGVEKSVTTPDGSGSGSSVRPGDELVYTLIAKNTGSTVATGVVLTDPIDSPVTQYVAGSAVPAPSRRVGSKLVWDLGTLNPGDTREIQFRVRIVESTQAVNVITNVAQISGQESGSIVTSRNSNVVDNPFEPSAVTLASFAATPLNNGKGVRVKWVTTSEVDTWSFTLYRAEGYRAGEAVAIDAEKVTPEAILGEGRGGGGGSYEFVDTNASVGKVYTYWLVETETTGRTNVYGPAKWGGGNTGGPTKVYLPMLKNH